MVSYWVGPVLQRFVCTIPNPLLGVAGGWGWWLIIVMVILMMALLHRSVAATINFPPQLRLQASHPIYPLLGFSAALAPNFTHSNQYFGFKRLVLVGGWVWEQSWKNYWGLKAGFEPPGLDWNPQGWF